MLTPCLLVALSLNHFAQTEAKPHVIPGKKHPGGNAESVAISADGKYVAAGYGGPSNGRFPLKPNGGGVYVWERETGKQVYSRGEYGDVIKVDFSRRGRYLAYSRVYTPGDSIELDTTVLIDLKSKQVVKSWPSAAFAFSTTDDVMVAAHRRATELYRLNTLKLERSIGIRGARAYAFSANGKMAAALCYYWVNRTGKPNGLAFFTPDRDKPRIFQDETLRSACALAVSPDGKHIVTGHTDGLARIWSTAEPGKPRSLKVDTGLALFPLFVQEGKALVLAAQPANGVSWSYNQAAPSGFHFKKGKTPPWCDLHQFDFASGKPKQTWRFEDGSFRTVYARFGSSRRYPEYNPARFALSMDGKVLVAGCNGCCTVDALTGKLLQTYVPANQAQDEEDQ